MVDLEKKLKSERQLHEKELTALCESQKQADIRSDVDKESVEASETDNGSNSTDGDASTNGKEGESSFANDLKCRYDAVLKESDQLRNKYANMESKVEDLQRQISIKVLWLPPFLRDTHTHTHTHSRPH